MADMYRESLYEGDMAEKNPLMNGYWRNKIPDFSRIQVPMYVTAGWSHFHLRGSINAFRFAGTNLKWLGAHRELDPELSTDYNPVMAHKRELKLSSGEVVPCDIEIYPTSRFWHAGETLYALA